MSGIEQSIIGLIQDLVTGKMQLYAEHTVYRCRIRKNQLDATGIDIYSH